MLGLRVLNHCILPSLKLQKNSLAADKRLWKPTLGYFPGNEHRSRLLTGFPPQQEAMTGSVCLDQQVAQMNSGSWAFACIAFLVPKPPSPYTVTLHARNKTLGMWAMQSCSSETPVQTTSTGKSLLRWGLRLSPAIRPHPDLGCPHRDTPALWAKINRKRKSVFMTQTRPDNFLGANPHTYCKHLSLVGCPSAQSLWAHLPCKARA